MPQNKNHLVGRSALSADSSNYTEAKQHLMSSKAGTKSGAVQSSINLGLNQRFYLMHRGKSWDETQRTPSTASPQLCASFWALPKDLWNWVEKALLDMSISLWTLPPSHSAAQLSREQQQRSLSHWNLASFLGSISELLTFGMGQHYLDANKCLSLVWRGVPWGRSRDWAEIRWRAQGKHFRRCLAMGWASVLWLPKQKTRATWGFLFLSRQNKISLLGCFFRDFSWGNGSGRELEWKPGQTTSRSRQSSAESWTIHYNQGLTQ